MLAATLLLTHTDEGLTLCPSFYTQGGLSADISEQAYWTLISILSRILPPGYYTPDLLSSRADQLVLAELVGLYVPKVNAHLEDLGVDLSSITFGWFLSLFTDCLPVEVGPGPASCSRFSAHRTTDSTQTLFRVWDVFFVEGHDVSFDTLYLYISLFRIPG